MGAKELRRLREVARLNRAGEDLWLLNQVRAAFRTGGCECEECRRAEYFLRATRDGSPRDTPKTG